MWGIEVLYSGFVQGLGAELLFLLLIYRRFDLTLTMIAGSLAGVSAVVLEYFLGNITKGIEYNLIYLATSIISGATPWAVKNLTLKVEAGEGILALGASGAGKSTFLHALAGVLGDADEGTATGSMTKGDKRPIDCRRQIGLVMQDPNSQVVLAKVGGDVAFGCENLGVPRNEIWPRVEAAHKAVSLNVGLDRPTSALSGGQLQRLAIAGALAMNAQILLLDEPTANLDPVGVREVRAAIENVTAERQRSLIVIERRVEVWADLVDRVVVLGADGIITDRPGAVDSRNPGAGAHHCVGHARRRLPAGTGRESP
ncbi:MAG: ECF transporter S component [Actinomycetaceae bacterium]|nr:ECF transporter S component [Actinomycetaceae bacterium]